MYRIEDYETGNVIEEFNTIELARQYCEKAEAKDKENGTYTPGFYAIRDTKTDELERFNY